MPKTFMRRLQFLTGLVICWLITLPSEPVLAQSEPALAQSEQSLTQSEPVLTQSVDSQFELWPVDLKIQGTVVAGGGGRLPQDIERLFLEIAKEDFGSAVVIRFEGATEWDESVVAEKFGDAKLLRQFSIAPDQSELTRQVLNAIDSANAVWIAADTAITKSQVIALKQLLTATTDVINRRGIVCVNGPAAKLLGKYKSDSMLGLTAIGSGGNLIPDSVILPNYNDGSNRNQLLSVLGGRPKAVGIGIPEETAIVLRGRKIRVVGEKAATFCLMANERQPIRVQHIRQPQSRRSSPYDTIVDLTAWRRDAIERTVAPFPAAKPPTPIVEHGTLIIVGGGGMPRGLMEKMVELAGGEDAKMVYVPCEESDEVTGPQRMVEAWKRMGVKSATFIHTKDRNQANSDESFLAPLKDATGIWFGGGRQWNFSDSYYGTKAQRLMQGVLDRGGVIGGSSAGASIQGAYMCRANPVANFDIMAPGYERGLGFIHGVAIDQHFTQRGRQKDMTQLVKRYPQLLGIGLDEATAIIVNQSKAKIVGRGKVHFYNRNEPVVPGQDDFLALEDGAEYDLADRKVLEPAAEDDGG